MTKKHENTRTKRNITDYEVITLVIRVVINMYSNQRNSSRKAQCEFGNCKQSLRKIVRKTIAS